MGKLALETLLRVIFVEKKLNVTIVSENIPEWQAYSTVKELNVEIN